MIINDNKIPLINSFSEKKLLRNEKGFMHITLENTPEAIIELDRLSKTIIDLKKTQEALRESEEKYRMVFSNVPLGILHFDAQGKITNCNDNFAHIIHTNKDQLIGAFLSDVLDIQMFSAMESTLEGTIGHYEGDYLSKISGKITPVRVNFAPIILENGVISGGVGIFEDVTERKQIERIFFHDIMNTAGNLHNLVEIIDDDNLSYSERKELIKTFAEVSKQIIDEINSHRHFITSEESNVKLNIQKISSLNFLQHILDSYNQADLFETHQLKISPESVDTEFKSDETLLRRVLWNMIKNAIEASKPGEIVTLKSDIKDGFVTFSVHNPGYIPEEIKSQIFDHSVSTKGAGRGLGIYSMKYLTEKYLNGKISFKSTKKEGTTFMISYPLQLSEHS